MGRARPATRNGRRRRDPEDTLTPEEEKLVAGGFRQIKRGQHVTWDQLKHALYL